MEQMVSKTMYLTIFLMMSWFFLQRMVATLAPKIARLHIEFRENAG